MSYIDGCIPIIPEFFTTINCGIATIVFELNDPAKL
jgi:hypothetical protein